ncbi:MAG: archease [Nanoarchaeota archaeon]
MKKFIFLPHTADVKFQAYGKTLEESFKNSALATAKAMFKGKVKEKKRKKIKAKGNDFENLLYNFLDEIVYLFDAENFLLSQVKKMKINNKQGFKLEAELIGDNSENYDINEHVKSVTYHDMFVKKEKNKYVVQVVLDV